MLIMTKPVASDRPLEQHEPLPAEKNFDSAYDWSPDPHLTVGEAMERFVGEIDRLAATLAGRQIHEGTTFCRPVRCSMESKNI